MTWLLAVALFVWVYLLLGRGMFWLMRERDDRESTDQTLARWPSIAIVVPARDEADVIAGTLGSLVLQDYPGATNIVLVDDQSGDGTGPVAQARIAELDASARAQIVSGRARPEGWTGKLWAMQQGIEAAATGSAPDFILFTDADITHAPDNLRRLVVRAEQGSLVLASLMAKLHCRRFSERLLIPAFVFFFDMLFPFRWANDPAQRIAAAAGGCMLARYDALIRAGGLVAIKGAIIDDCALARIMKRQGPIWLGLTERAVSNRPYDGLAGIRRMVARSAFAQLGYSALVLLGTLAGMFLIYLLGPMAAILGSGAVRLEGVVAWAMMALAFQPMLRFYRLSPFWGMALPITAALYTAFTVDSAFQYWRGRGGMWKGRAQAMA